MQILCGEIKLNYTLFFSDFLEFTYIIIMGTKYKFLIKSQMKNNTDQCASKYQNTN